MPFHSGRTCLRFLLWTLLLALRSKPILAGLALPLRFFEGDNAAASLFAIMGPSNFKILNKTAPILILVDVVCA